MTSIEYTIYAELNNTYDLNSKRLILNSLMDRIKAQIQKISSLSRDVVDEIREVIAEFPVCGNYRYSCLQKNSAKR